MSDPIPGLTRSQVRRLAALNNADIPELPGEVTPCPTVCKPWCDHGPEWCHERCVEPGAQIHSPDACERRRRERRP